MCEPREPESDHGHGLAVSVVLVASLPTVTADRRADRAGLVGASPPRTAGGASDGKYVKFKTPKQKRRRKA
jgi:hypothetical protein